MVSKDVPGSVNSANKFRKIDPLEARKSPMTKPFVEMLHINEGVSIMSSIWSTAGLQKSSINILDLGT